MQLKTVSVADSAHLMTAGDVAALLHTSRAAVYKMVERGVLPRRA